MPPIPSVGGNGSHILVHAQTEDRKRERDSLEMESRNLALAKGGSKKEGEKGVEGGGVEEAEERECQWKPCWVARKAGFYTRAQWNSDVVCLLLVGDASEINACYLDILSLWQHLSVCVCWRWHLW